MMMYGNPILNPSAYLTGGLAVLPAGLQPPFNEPTNSRNQVELIRRDSQNFMRYATMHI